MTINKDAVNEVKTDSIAINLQRAVAFIAARQLDPHTR